MREPKSVYPDWVRLVELLTTKPTLCCALRLENKWLPDEMRVAVRAARKRGYRILHERFAEDEEQPRWHMRLDRASYKRAHAELPDYINVLEDGEYITVHDAAMWCAVPYGTAIDWVYKGKVESKRVGRRYWVDIGTLPKNKEESREASSQGTN